MGVYPAQQADDFQWEIIDEVMQSRDSAMNQVAEKNVELFNWLVKVKQQYAKLKDQNSTFKDSDVKLKARVIRLEQELQLHQSHVNPVCAKNLNQAAAATEIEESKELVTKKQRKTKKNNKRKKSRVVKESDDDDLTFLDAIIV